MGMEVTMTGTLKLVGIGGLLLLAMCGVVMVINGGHAELRHGLTAVNETRDMMDRCRDYNGIKMTDGEVFIIALLFPGDRACLRVTSADPADPSAREITTIPQECMTRPGCYIRNLIKRGYQIVETWGDVPEWLEALK
jgi:hypothetical protein